MTPSQCGLKLQSIQIERHKQQNQRRTTERTKKKKKKGKLSKRKLTLAHTKQHTQQHTHSLETFFTILLQFLFILDNFQEF